VALLFGLALLPMGVMTLNAGLQAAALSETAAQSDTAERVRADLIERQKEVTRLRAVARAIAANPDTAGLPVQRCNAMLASLTGEFREFTSLALLDAQARAVCASDPAAVGGQTATAPLIARAAERSDVTIAYIAAPRLAAEPAIAAVAPIGRPGRPTSIYVGAMRAVAPLLLHRATDESDFGAVVDGAGRILQSSGIAPDSPLHRRLARALAEGGALTQSGPLRIGSAWAVSQSLGDDGLYLVQGWRAGPTAFADALHMLWALAAPLLVWFMAVAASWLAVEIVVARPLTALEGHARSYARGEEVTAPVENEPYEIGSLRRTLAAMAKTLRGRESRLAEALHEERALLRELNHRVNNNLQLVASILAIQSRAAPNAQQAMGLERAQERIQLLALAQKRIYSSGEVHGDVPVDELAADIARSLAMSRGVRTDNVELQLDLAPARAPVDMAAPLAFLIGESISHALDMLQDGPRAPLLVQLTHADGWIGFAVSSPGAAPRQAPPSPARRIVEAFAGQIGADMAYDADDPLAVRLRFPLPMGTQGAPAPLSQVRTVAPSGKDIDMNWQQVDGKWDQLKGSVQKQWGKLTDDDLTRARGSRDEFVGRVKERYGIAKEEAEKQVDDFMDRQH